MAFNKSTGMIERKKWQEDLPFRGKPEKDPEKLIQKAIGKISSILKAETITVVTRDLIKQKYSSASLRNMLKDDPSYLEKICSPADPIIVIALMQYYEVNKSELEKKN